MTTTPRLCVQLTASDEWPESDDAHRALVEAALAEQYPGAEIEVTIGEVSSLRVTGTLDLDPYEDVRDVSEAVWDSLCSDPEAHGL